jgi:hypothetical protein
MVDGIVVQSEEERSEIGCNSALRRASVEAGMVPM